MPANTATDPIKARRSAVYGVFAGGGGGWKHGESGLRKMNTIREAIALGERRNRHFMQQRFNFGEEGS